MTEDIIDKMRRWAGQQAPAILSVGEWLHWRIVRANELVNDVTRHPNMEF